MGQVWYIHTMEYCLALKREQILMNPEDIMASEISQTQRDNCYTIPPTQVLEEANSQRPEVECRGLGRGVEGSWA